MNADVIVAALGGMVSIMVALIGVFAAYLKLRSDSSSSLAAVEAEERTQFRRELREEIARLRNIVAEQEVRIRELEREIEVLSKERNLVISQRDALLQRSALN